MKGTVKKIVAERGFGFIATEDGKDIFFHKSSFSGAGGDFVNLREGTSVEFDVEQGPKGYRAANVKVAGDERPTS